MRLYDSLVNLNIFGPGFFTNHRTNAKQKRRKHNSVGEQATYTECASQGRKKAEKESNPRYSRSSIPLAYTLPPLILFDTLPLFMAFSTFPPDTKGWERTMQEHCRSNGAKHARQHQDFCCCCVICHFVRLRVWIKASLWSSILV